MAGPNLPVSFWQKLLPSITGLALPVYVHFLAMVKIKTTPTQLLPLLGVLFLKKYLLRCGALAIKAGIFVHIDDVLDCIAVAMDKIHDGTAINIGQGVLTSFRELIALFCEFADYSPEIKPLLDKPVGVHSRYCDMSWVKENLGWEPKISIKEGMRRVYDAVIVREKTFREFIIKWVKN